MANTVAKFLRIRLPNFSASSTTCVSRSLATATLCPGILDLDKVAGGQAPGWRLKAVERRGLRKSPVLSRSSSLAAHASVNGSAGAGQEQLGGGARAGQGRLGGWQALMGGSWSERSSAREELPPPQVRERERGAGPRC
jgi:hypothetical protein